jgi:hypothetical protein
VNNERPLDDPQLERIDHTEGTNDATIQSEEDVDVQRKLANFTGYLVWVGGLQVLILFVQAVLFRRQTKIMGQHKVSLEQLATAAADNAIAAKDR